LPEGGFYFESARSEESIEAGSLPSRYDGPRSLHTAIYYLLTSGSVSTMHRVRSDEVFHFYLGDPVEMLQLFPDGSHKVHMIGTDLAAGQRPQLVVAHGVWQGCRLVSGGDFALMGTTVAPGFEFSDYEQGNREELVRLYPECRELIIGLT